MDQASKERRLAALLEHICRQWETRRQAAQDGQSPSRPFTIALSRESGTQGTTVAQELGSRLGWPTYDHELLERIAQDMNLRTQFTGERG